MLVPDRRWVYTRQQSTEASLISLLNNGPNPLLGDAVNSLVPPTATVRTQRIEDGEFEWVHRSDRAESGGPPAGSQVVWTLAGADVRGPYRLIADGTLLSEDVGRPGGSMMSLSLTRVPALRDAACGLSGQVRGSANPTPTSADGRLVGVELSSLWRSPPRRTCLQRSRGWRPSAYSCWWASRREHQQVLGAKS